MKKLTATLVCFVLVLSLSGMTTFEKNYIRNYRETGKTVKQTADGGYIVAAVSEFSETYLLRINNTGDTLWTRLYDGVCNDVVEEQDGSFVLCGSLSGNALLRKVDGNGTPVWAKTFGGISDEVANSLLQTSDGGFMFCGYTQSLGPVFQSIYCVRTDNMGNAVWEKFYSKLTVGWGQAIRELSNGNFLICGNTSIISDGPSFIQVVLIKINPSGDTLWTRDYADGTEATSFAETADNGYLICGNIGLIPSGNAVSLVNFDSVGNFQWSRQLLLGTSSVGTYIERTDDDNFIVTGTSDNNLFVFKADNTGDTIWTRFYNNNTIAKGNCIRQTSDGGYVVCGQSGSSTTSFSTYLIKTDDAGLVTGFENHQPGDIYISVYPNPGTDVLNITLPAVNMGCQIQLIDQSGNVRVQSSINSGSLQKTIDVSDLSKGCYLMKILLDNGNHKTLKIIIH